MQRARFRRCFGRCGPLLARLGSLCLMARRGTTVQSRALMRALAIVGLSLLLTACAESESPLAQSFEKYVGHEYRVGNRNLSLCTGPGSGCSPIGARSFTVKQVYAPFYLVVETPDGRTGYIYGEDMRAVAGGGRTQHAGTAQHSKSSKRHSEPAADGSG